MPSQAGQSPLEGPVCCSFQRPPKAILHAEHGTSPGSQGDREAARRGCCFWVGRGREQSTPALGGPWDTPAGWQSLCHEATCWAVMTLEPETWFKPQLCTD